MRKVFIKIPKSGLGNGLLVWAYGTVFAHINQLPVTVSKWWGFRWGALLRRENKKRLYFGYFKEESFLKIWVMRLQLLIQKKVFNPPLSPATEDNAIFVFDKLPAHNYFINLAPYEELIKTRLSDLLAPAVQKECSSGTAPVIGIHIRRGDFKFANHITPLSYFIEIISNIRKTFGEELPVTVFTDANKDEISGLFELPNIHLYRGTFDIADILLLSRSRFLIMSRDSSFSYWAAFLSDAFVIMHDGDWQKKLKPDNGLYREFRYAEGVSRAAFVETLKMHAMV